MKKLTILSFQFSAFLILLVFSTVINAQENDSGKITVRTTRANGNLYMLNCIGGFGGSNVAAFIGEDGILLVDNMFIPIVPKMQTALKAISDKPITYVINTHFHGDHVAGNMAIEPSPTIISHENTRKKLIKNPKKLLAQITFKDSISLHFNGEEVSIVHYPNGHTDSDLVIYFPQSKVAHLGDMFFHGMFPAVYTEGGGNIRQLITNLEKVYTSLPTDAKIIPGHGDIATMTDLRNFITMLKETTNIVETNIKQGKTLEQMQKEKVLTKYDKLGEGGAQTTEQFLAMLCKLLS